MIEALQDLAVQVVLPAAQVAAAVTLGLVALASLASSVVRLISRLLD